MPGRQFWKGYLKLSLVTCAVSLHPAVTQGRKIRFNMVDRRSGERVESRYVDSVTGKPVDDEDEMRAFEHADGRYVEINDEDLAAVGLKSARTIDIETFLPAGSIDWIYFDVPHYLMPNDEVSAEAFSVIREAMGKSKTQALSRIALNRRERAVLIEPRGKGMIMWTLRYGDEVRPPPENDDDAPDPAKDEMALMEKLIEKRRQDFAPEFLADPVEKKLAALIESKRSKKRAPKAKTRKDDDEKPTNVVDITQALKDSLARKKK